MADIGTTPADITRVATKLNNEVRLPILEAGMIHKLATFEIEINLATDAAYNTGGFPIGHLLTALGIAHASHVIEARPGRLYGYAASAYVYTNGFDTEFDPVNQKIVLFKNTKAAAGAGSGAEGGQSEVADTTAINGATYLNGNTARMRFSIHYKVAM